MDLNNVVWSQFYSPPSDVWNRGSNEQARYLSISFGVAEVLRFMTAQDYQCGRSLSQIRNDHADYYVLCMPMKARILIQQNGRECELAPGCYALLTTSKPFRAMLYGAVPGEEVKSAVFTRISGGALRELVCNVDEICANRLEVGPGAGNMLLSLLQLTLHEGIHLSEYQRIHAGSILINAISSAMRPLSERMLEQAPNYYPSRDLILYRAKAFIESQLSNPALDVTQVAGHCRVSTRYLHKVFESTEHTVASFIRESRLKRCREAIRNPALRNKLITDIASDWGIEEPAHFSRLYKARFGVSPRADRAAGTLKIPLE